MSDQTPGQPENPYGGSEPVNPYGQPSPGQGQSQPGQDPHHAPPPYGQPPQQPPYGQPQPHGQPGWAPHPGHPVPDPDRRPGTVTAAAWIAIAMSGLTALLLLGVAGMFFAARDLIMPEIRTQPGFEDVDPDQVVSVVIAVVLVLAVWSLVAVGLGILTLRRSNAGRILLAVSAAVAALLSLLAIASGASAVTFLAALATAVLLFVGGANDWFARRGWPAPGPHQYQQPGPGQPGQGQQPPGQPPGQGY